MKKSILREYARLIARSGVNIQPGQEVFITAELDQPEFVKMLVEECYRCKASKVVVDWSYQPLQKLHFRYRTLTSLSKLDNYEEARWQHYVDTIPCRIYLISEDPDGLRGVNQEKMARSQQAKYPIIKGYRDQIENKYQWCIAAVPGEKWAKKLFPELRASQAVEKLWEAILKTSRVTDDPIQAWEEHNKDLHDRCEYLNSLHIRELRYKSSNGTDFTVGMIPEAQFCGGGETSLQGIFFNPNIPTEECFISPMRGVAEGIVYATKPLSYQGHIINNFHIDFKDGILTQREYLLARDVYQKEIAAYETELQELQAIKTKTKVTETGTRKWNRLISRYYKAETVTEEMVEAMVDEIRVNTDGSLDIRFKYMPEFEEMFKECERIRKEVA